MEVAWTPIVSLVMFTIGAGVAHCWNNMISVDRVLACTSLVKEADSGSCTKLYRKQERTAQQKISEDGAFKRAHRRISRKITSKGP